MKETDATQTGMTVARRRPWAKLSEYLAAPLVLVTPFVLFVTYHEYRLLSPEILWCVLILVGIGLMASVVTLLGGMARVLISAGLLTFYLEVQIDWLTPRMIAATYLGLVPVCWLLRRHVWELMAGFSTVTVVLTLAFPESTRIGENASVQEETTAPAATLPPLLHIVLDEHIGVAGIPTDISGGRALRTALVEFYEGNGFRLFGRAFSQYVNTRDSMSNLLNLTSEDRSAVYFVNQTGDYYLPVNAYFRILSERGYVLRVYQSDYLRFCEAEDVRVASCLQYRSNSIKSIEGVPLGTARKTVFILRNFLRRFTTLEYLRMRYRRRLRPWLLDSGFAPADWPPGPGVMAITAFPVIDRLREDITKSPNGTAFFAHLLTPHAPYVYDADCELRLEGSQWLWPEVAPTNTPASRAELYPDYFEQVNCVTQQLQGLFDALKVAGVFDEATIIVHGDHGSRINLGSDQERLTPSGVVERFSTLFAIKSPQVTPGYDEHMSPLQDLLASAVGLDPVVDDPASVFSGTTVSGRLRSVPMPSFGQR